MYLLSALSYSQSDNGASITAAVISFSVEIRAGRRVEQKTYPVSSFSVSRKKKPLRFQARIRAHTSVPSVPVRTDFFSMMSNSSQWSSLQKTRTGAAVTPEQIVRRARDTSNRFMGLSFKCTCTSAALDGPAGQRFQ